MRVALAKSTLRIPPTYFALNHAEQLREQHEFCMFTLAADIRDPAITIDVRDFVGFRSARFAQRERFIPLAMAAMSRAIRAYKPDVIHQHFATWSIPAMRASSRASIPLLTTVHGVDVMTALQPARTAMQHWHHRNITAAQRQSSRVLAVSQYLASQAVKGGFEPSRLEVHYQGIDTDFYTPSPTGPDAARAPLVVFVGALNEQKGVRDLVAASQRLVGTVEHELVIIGTGSLAAEVAAATSASPHVRMLGALARDEVRDWLRRSTVLVLAAQESGGRREAAGLALLEAQACGTPVVAYNSGGTAEMIDDGTSGLVVAESDQNALTAGLRDVLTMKSRSYERMRRAARSFVVNERSLAGSAAELAQHYADITR